MSDVSGALVVVVKRQYGPGHRGSEVNGPSISGGLGVAEMNR